MFADEISNLKIISVLELSWNSTNNTALPRPYHALSFRTEGNAEFIANNISEKVYEKKDIMFVPQNCGYDIKSGKNLLFCVHFLADNLPEDKLIKFSVSNGSSFEKLFASMYEKWGKKTPGYLAGVMSDFYKIISKIQINQIDKKLSSVSNSMNDAIQYIHEHFTEPDLTIHKISESISISESYFRKLFKKIYEIAPIKYINELRVEHALNLISSGYYNIYEVSEMSGFSDPKYFSTVVKKTTGLSPNEHKKNGLLRFPTE